MSSSYSSLDWVLSHWAYSLCIDSFVFMFVLCALSCHTAYVLYYCNTVGWTWWDWSLILRTFLQCFDTVGWVTWSVKTHPRYDVFGGMLNFTKPAKLEINNRQLCKHWSGDGLEFFVWMSGSGMKFCGDWWRLVYFLSRCMFTTFKGRAAYCCSNITGLNTQSRYIVTITLCSQIPIPMQYLLSFC